MAAIEWEVSSVLSLATAATNIIELGSPAFISVKDNHRNEIASALRKCTIGNQSKTFRLSSLITMPTATVAGRSTGELACSDITVTTIGKGVYLVKFEPRLADDYALVVRYSDGQDIKGSPFNVKVVEKGTLTAGHWSDTSDKGPPTVPIGEAVNVVIPDSDVFGTQLQLEAKRKLSVVVQSSLGVCDAVSINQLPHFNATSVSFKPDIASSYFIKVSTPDLPDETAKTKTYVVEAHSSNDQAVSCFVHQKDLHIFERPLNFCSSTPVKFRISKPKDVRSAPGNKLDVFCQGPGKVSVKLINDKTHSGFEICELVPSAAGKYRVDIFWAGKPIRGSPFFLNFKSPRRRIGSSGLDLEEQNFRIGVPHGFRLNCSDLGEGELKISCHPSSAADISAKRVLNDRGQLHYHCQVIPRKVGQHELRIKFDGHHIEESPCQVHFKPRGDATKCCMVSTPSFRDDAGGNVYFQVSTAGAGEGKLVAVAEESSKNTYSRAACPVDMKQLSTDLYEVQFDPGTMHECLVSVTYDNNHIYGSPFKMTFREVNQCEVSGEGLRSAQVGSWNHFHVSTEKAGPGALLVKIESENGDKVDPIITRLTPHLLEVRYRPMVTGKYSISLQWGQATVPGSPFQVQCYSNNLSVVKQPPAEVPYGAQVKFKIHQTDGRTLSLNDFSIAAINNQAHTCKTLGVVTKPKSIASTHSASAQYYPRADAISY